MYSGTTLTPISGRLLGAHQKIDRLARTSLETLAPGAKFPGIKDILHFEGANGPDAIKRKSPAQDEPWHYFEPFNPDDKQLLELAEGHYAALVKALKAEDVIHAAFEAAWLAHALVDGLTPAHHYPYEEKLAEIRGGEGKESRDTIRGKLIMPGDTKREQLRNNWSMWGPRGLLFSHGRFEWGIAGIITPMRARTFAPSEEDLTEVERDGIMELFRRKAQQVAGLDLYEKYLRWGWTPRLARVVKRQLVPVVVEVVTLAWYAANAEAER